MRPQVQLRIGGQRKTKTLNRPEEAEVVVDAVQAAIDIGRPFDLDEVADEALEGAILTREEQARHEKKLQEPGSGYMTWDGLRDTLGQTRNRLGLLQLLGAASGYEPLEHQLRMHLADAGPGRTTNKLMLGGVGCGKTKWSSAESHSAILANPGTKSAILAPTYDQVLHVLLPEWEGMADAMAQNGYPLVRRFKHAIARADLVCGGWVFFRSFDRVDNIRGFNYGMVALDETEQVMRPGYVFRTLAGRIRDASANILQMHCTTTPRGYRGVVRMFVEQRQNADAIEDPAARRQAKREWFAVRAKSTANTHLPSSFVDNLKASYSKREYEQEVEGKVLKPSTVVWPEFERAVHLLPYRYDPSLPYGFSVDWGYHYPHVLFFQYRDDGAMVVFAEFCEDNVPPDKLKDWLKKACKQLDKPPEQISADRAEPRLNGWLYKAFPGAKVEVMVTKQEQRVTEGIELVRRKLDPLEGPPMLFFAEKLAQDPPRRGIVRCLENYRFRQHKDDTVSDEPLKDNVHDHGADSLRYHVVAYGDEARRAFTIVRQGPRDPKRRRPGR